jgi:transposase
LRNARQEVRFIQAIEGTAQMVTIGVDPHKQSHTAVAVSEIGVQLAQHTVPARPIGNGLLVEWARSLDAERCG